MKIENPFYHNYVFDRWDADRMKIGLLDRLWLWIFPTKVQFIDGYVVMYKHVGGRYYFLGMEPISVTADGFRNASGPFRWTAIKSKPIRGMS